jgi:hypothetical protein
MIGKLQCVVLDCPDAPGLARFCQALDNLTGGAIAGVGATEEER